MTFKWIYWSSYIVIYWKDKLHSSSHKILHPKCQENPISKRKVTLKKGSPTLRHWEFIVQQIDCLENADTLVCMYYGRLIALEILFGICYYKDSDLIPKPWKEQGDPGWEYGMGKKGNKTQQAMNRGCRYSAYINIAKCSWFQVWK